MRNIHIGALIFLLLGSTSGVNAQTAVEKMLAARFAAQVELAAAGDLGAQLTVAEAYQHGSGVEKSVVEAIRWYEMAAGQSDASAMWRLGTLVVDGFEPDDKSADAQAATQKSLEWYHGAAQMGFAPAQHSLGLLYGLSERAEIDRVRGRMWMFIAEENDHAMTTWLIDKLEKDMTDDEREAAQERAKICLLSSYVDCE